MRAIRYKDTIHLILKSKRYPIIYWVVNFGHKERIYVIHEHEIFIVEAIDNFSIQDKVLLSMFFSKVYGGVKSLLEILEKFRSDRSKIHVKFSITRDDPLFIEDIKEIIPNYDPSKPIAYQLTALKI